MISIATRLIADELAKYIVNNQRSGNLNINDIILDNIANLESEGSQELIDKVIITSVNIEEESTLKNKQPYVPIVTGGIEYLEPPVHLNLYLLFTCTFESGSTDAYETALHRLSLIIQFFQAKKLFTVDNSPHSSIASADTLNEFVKNELRLTMELYTLTFEQINHLWGSLGGKQVPFAMYKARLIKIQHRVAREVPIIEETQASISSSNLPLNV